MNIIWYSYMFLKSLYVLITVSNPAPRPGEPVFGLVMGMPEP